MRAFLFLVGLLYLETIFGIIKNDIFFLIILFGKKTPYPLFKQVRCTFPNNYIDIRQPTLWLSIVGFGDLRNNLRLCARLHTPFGAIPLLFLCIHPLLGTLLTSVWSVFTAIVPEANYIGTKLKLKLHLLSMWPYYSRLANPTPQQRSSTQKTLPHLFNPARGDGTFLIW